MAMPSMSMFAEGYGPQGGMGQNPLGANAQIGKESEQTARSVPGAIADVVQSIKGGWEKGQAQLRAKQERDRLMGLQNPTGASSTSFLNPGGPQTSPDFPPAGPMGGQAMPANPMPNPATDPNNPMNQPGFMAGGGGPVPFMGMGGGGGPTNYGWSNSTPIDQSQLFAEQSPNDIGMSALFGGGGAGGGFGGFGGGGW